MKIEWSEKATEREKSKRRKPRKARKDEVKNSMELIGFIWNETEKLTEGRWRKIRKKHILYSQFQTKP